MVHLLMPAKANLPPRPLCLEVLVIVFSGCCRNLMAPQSLEELGFKEGEAQAQPRPKGPEQPKQSREQTGFIAGLYVKQPYPQK